MCITIPCETRVEQTEQSVHLKKNWEKHRTKWDFLPLRDSRDLPCRWRRSEPSLRPAAHLVALWRVCAQWSWGWRGQAGQYPGPRTRTSEDGRFCCSSHPPCAHKRGYLVLISYSPQRVISGASYLLRTHMIWVICSEVPPVILYQGKLAPAINETEQHKLTCPSPVCCWWWNKWGQSPSPADPESSERPGWWSSRWSDTPHRSGSRTGSAKRDKARQSLGITVQTPVHLKEGWSGNFHDKSWGCCTCSAKKKLEVRREGCTNLPCGVEFCGCRSQDGAAITQDRGSRCQRWLIKCDGLQPLLPRKQWITLSVIILQNKSSCSSHQDPTGNLKWGIYIQGQSMTAQPQG